MDLGILKAIGNTPMVEVSVGDTHLMANPRAEHTPDKAIAKLPDEDSTMVVSLLIVLIRRKE